jgi:hypothetical protein
MGAKTFKKYSQITANFNGPLALTNILGVRTLGSEKKPLLYSNLDSPSQETLTNLAIFANILAKYANINISSIGIGEKGPFLLASFPDVNNKIKKIHLKKVTYLEVNNKLGIIKVQAEDDSTYPKLVEISATIKDQEDKYVVVEDAEKYLTEKKIDDLLWWCGSRYMMHGWEGNPLHNIIHITDKKGQYLCARESENAKAKQAVKDILPDLYRGEQSVLARLAQQNHEIKKVLFDQAEVEGYYQKHIGFQAPHADHCLLVMVDNQERCFVADYTKTSQECKFTDNELFYNCKTRIDFWGKTVAPYPPVVKHLGYINFGVDFHPGSAKEYEHTPLKAVLILGEAIILPPQIENLLRQPSHLLLKPNDRHLTNDIMQALNNRIDNNTKIIITTHGNAYRGKHVTATFIAAQGNNMELDSKKDLEDGPISSRTSYLLKLLDSLTTYPLDVHLISCYAGSANSDITYLKPGSSLTTYGKEDLVTLVVSGNWIIEQLLSTELEQSPAQTFINQMRLFSEVATYKQNLGEGGVFTYRYDPSLKINLTSIQQDFIDRFYHEVGADRQLNLYSQPITEEEISHQKSLYLGYLKNFVYFNNDDSHLVNFLQDRENKDFILQEWQHDLSVTLTGADLKTVPLPLILTPQLINLLSNIGVDFSLNNNDWSWNTLTYVLYRTETEKKNLIDAAKILIELEVPFFNQVLVQEGYPESFNIDNDAALISKSHLTMTTDKDLLEILVNKYLEHHIELSPNEVSHISSVMGMTTHDLSVLLLRAKKCAVKLELSEMPAQKSDMQQESYLELFKKALIDYLPSYMVPEWAIDCDDF